MLTEILLHQWHPSCCLSGDKLNSVGHIQGKEDGIEVTTIGTYRSSFVKQILQNDQTPRISVRKLHEGMISTKSRCLLILKT